MTPWTVAQQAALWFSISQSLLKLMSIESVMLANHLIFCLPLLPYLQLFPETGSFPMSWLFASGSQSFGASASALALPISIQGWLPLGLTGLISWKPRDSQESCPAPQFESISSFLNQFFSLLYGLSHPYIWLSHSTTEENHLFNYMDFVIKVMSLLFNMLFRFVIAFLPRRRHLLLSWLQSPSTVILEPKKIKSVSVSIVPPPVCHEVIGLDAMILVFWILSFKPTFSLSSFTFIKRLFSSSLLSATRVVSFAYLRLLIFLPAIYMYIHIYMFQETFIDVKYM